MILSIESDLASFKTVELSRGLNVVLSDKAPGSNDRKTRNSAGKSSLIELTHFLLGSSATGALPLHKALVDYTFFGTFLLKGRTVQVSRSGSDHGKIYFTDARDAKAFDLPAKTGKGGATYVLNDDWKEFLGHAMFGMPFPTAGTDYAKSYSPSFRKLLAYFMRRKGGFARAESTSERQGTWDPQVHISYLLGLDWRVPWELEQIRQSERQLAELKKAAKGQTVGAIIGTVAELRPKIVRAEAVVEALRKNVAEFRVVDAYRAWSDQAAALMRDMQALEREAVLLKQSLDHVEQALANEQAPQADDVERLYQSVGLELPGTAVRRFEEVREFHLSVVANRRLRLEREASDLRERITAGENSVRELDEKRSAILRNLAGGGAFEDLTALQSQLSTADAELGAFRERFKAAEMLEGKVTELKIDRANLTRRLQEDHQARQAKLDKAILEVGRIIEALYDDRTGELVVKATDNGPVFEIQIEGDRGGGISQMEIFCLDAAMFRTSNAEHGGPKVLVHDSHLFDGVDERQVAQALNIGRVAADELDGQYIVTMNSDVFDRLPLPPEIDRKAVVNSTRLSDDGETGGLFGFRFD